MRDEPAGRKIDTIGGADAPSLRRRSFVAGVAMAPAALLLGPSTWRSAFAQTAEPGKGPYGPLSDSGSALGVRLPEGFEVRLLATSGEVVEGTEYEWHPAPDGGATFAAEDGGWVYVSNSEVPLTGGVGAIRFDSEAKVVDAYRILDGTTGNCAGGPTPWGTWLSCEEFDLHGLPALEAAAPSVAGQVWETFPMGDGEAVALPALGLFQHEAAAVDPDVGAVYLTEDQPDGRFYRFTPDSYPDLTSGTLEAAALEGTTVSWVPVADPAGETEPTRTQVPSATAFAGGEGIWFHEGRVFFTTKLDGKVHAIETASDTYELIYDGASLGDDAPLRGVDNLTVEAGSGDIYVAEDGGTMQIVIISAEGEVAPFLQLEDQDDSEITGPAFSPDGTRLYFSSQRGRDGAGLTYEVTGPFRGASAEGGGAGTGAEPTAGAGGDDSDTAAAAASAEDGGDSGSGGALPIAAGLVALGAVAGGAVLVARRRGTKADSASTTDASGGSAGNGPGAD